MKIKIKTIHGTLFLSWILRTKQVIFDLKNCHGIRISLSTLKRRLRDHGLKRRGAQIEDQVPRERVANLLGELNPDGTRERRRRKLTRRRYISYEPNFSWHVDG